MCKEKIAIYHRVYRRENFEKAAKDLFGLVRMAQKQEPNVERILYVDIDGHKNAMGGYDADMQELQIEFGVNVLLPFVQELHFPLGVIRNKGKQNNNVPDRLIIGNMRNERCEDLEKLYIENYSNTEFMSENDVYQYMKKVSDFLKDYTEDAFGNYENYEYDELGHLKMWNKHINELIIELYNSFIHGNYLSVAAMTRTLMECYVFVTIIKKEQSKELLDEWWLCNMIHKIKPHKGTALSEKQIDCVREYCIRRNINFQEKWKYYTEYAKKNNGWLRTLMQEKGVGFSALCEYINEKDIEKDYEGASSFVHGQDVEAKSGPFTLYSSIYIRLYIMMQYIFKAIRLFDINEKMEDSMIELEEGLLELGERYLV